MTAIDVRRGRCFNICSCFQYGMMDMLSETKKFLEWNDLTQLHIQFGEEDNNVLVGDEIDVPKVETLAREDVWTDAVSAASSNQVSNIRSVYAKVKHSNLSMDGKYWWDAVLTVGMDAPLEELERLLKKNVNGQSDNKSDYINIAAKKIAYDAAERERRIRKKREQEEKARLLKLQEEANKRQQEKDIAEYNLKQHRESQGDRR